jgi:hypothetical protein
MAEHKSGNPEELAKQLRAKMRKERPRSFSTFLALLLLCGTPLALLAWWLWPGRDLPRLMVIAFDQIALPGETVPLRARLTPEDPRVSAPDLGGLDVSFAELKPPSPQGEPPQQAQARSAGNGEAVVRWKAPAGDEAAEFQAAYTDPRAHYRAPDQARVFARRAQTPLLLVAVDALAEAGDDAWVRAPIGTIAVRPAADKALQAARDRQYQVVYLAAGAGSPIVYRKMRGWVELKAQEQRVLPEGPVLGQLPAPGAAPAASNWAEVFADLKKRFRGPVVGVGKEVPLAEALRGAGATALVVGEGDQAPAGVTRLASWAELAAKLPR